MWDEINPRGGTRHFFEPIAVRGGETVVRICEFNLSGVTPDTLKNGVHLLQLQMPRPRRSFPWWRRSELAEQPLRWQTLGEFAFHVTEHERRGFGAPDAHFNGLRAKQPNAPVVSSM
jgi:hypothetical protein